MNQQVLDVFRDSVGLLLLDSYQPEKEIKKCCFCAASMCRSFSLPARHYSDNKIVFVEKVFRDKR